MLDLRKLSNVTDFFVICSSISVIGVKAIAEEIIYRLKEEGIAAHHVEGEEAGTWILADYGDVIVHIFLDEIRRYFDLESFWGDAPRKSFEPTAQKKPGKRKTRK